MDVLTSPLPWRYADEGDDCASSQSDRQFVKFTKNPRRDDAGKDAAEGSAGSDHEIKNGQVPRLGFEARELSMANHAAHKKPHAVKRNLQRGPALANSGARA